MFHFLRGNLALLRPSLAVLDVGGAGFQLTISDRTFSALSGAEKSAVQLFTHLSVREDGMELFGFADEAEQETFRLLIGVSGIGPKAAMAILSAFSPEQFALAVATEDKKSIAKANGIGPKTAARISLELRDKMSGNASFAPSPAGAAAISLPPQNSKTGEAEEALSVLGYSRSEILRALSTMDTAAMSVEDMIRGALKQLAKM